MEALQEGFLQSHVFCPEINRDSDPRYRQATRQTQAPLHLFQSSRLPYPGVQRLLTKLLFLWKPYCLFSCFFSHSEATSFTHLPAQVSG